MKSLFPLNIGRLCIASTCATALVLALFFFDIYFVNDSDSHVYTIWEAVAECAMLVSSWPILVVALIWGEDTSMALLIFLWLVSGLFWGLIIEFCLRIRDARKAQRASSPGGSGVAGAPPSGS
jgi:hypothetical protein